MTGAEVDDSFRLGNVNIGYSNSAHGTSSTESIFATIKLDYKVGSSCLNEDPYGSEEVIIGGKVFINGNEVAMPESFRPMGGYDKHTKTVKLTGFSSREPVIDLGHSGSSEDLQAYHPNVIKDGSTYKMWYVGHDGSNSRIHYATSTNGVDWDKHGIVVDLGSSGDTDEAMVHHCSVIKDGSTFKMWYAGRDASVYRLHYATSSDGISWSKQGMVLDTGNNGNFSEAHLYYPHVIKDGSTYKMWYSANNGSYAQICYATSSDGISWNKHGLVLGIDSTILTESGAVYHSCVIKDGALYKMFYFGLGGTYGVTNYAVSSDGINWIRKGIIKDSSTSGSFEDVNQHGLCVIKDGSSYKAWGSSNDGSNYRIGYSVLAMSDPNNTGSSTTGVYTNTNPQVNFGFKSNDTIVLHYERIAQQKSAKAETLDIWPKDISWVGKPALGATPTTAFNSLQLSSVLNYSRLGTILRLDPSQYSINSSKDLKYRYGIYMASALDYVEEYYRITYGTGSFEGFTFEDLRMNITPESNILKGDYSRITFSSPSQYRLNGVTSDKNEETLNCLIGTSIAKRDNGEVIMLIGFVSAAIHLPIFYAIGALGATIPMLGRPLVK